MVLSALRAKQWMWLAIGGSLLAAATYLLIFVPIPRCAVAGAGFWATVWAYRLQIVALVLPPVLGISVSLWAERRFKRGFLDDRWTEAELSSVRAVVGSRAWGWVGFVALLAFLRPVLLHTHPGGGGFAYVLLLPSQTVMRMRQLITPKVPRNPGLVDWANFKPIRSEHWGGRGA